MLLVFMWPPHVLSLPQPTLQLVGTFLQAPRFLFPPWVSSSFPPPRPSTQAKPPLTLPSFSHAFSPSIHPLPQNGPSAPSCIIPGRCPSCLCKRKRRSGPGLLTDISCSQGGGFGRLRDASTPLPTGVAFAYRSLSCIQALQLSISLHSPLPQTKQPTGDAWPVTGVCTCSSIPTEDGKNQTSPKLRLHRSRNTAALGWRWSKPSHGDAHRQHLPHRKETGREQL